MHSETKLQEIIDIVKNMSKKFTITRKLCYQCA
jgi:hypothetical protein